MDKSQYRGIFVIVVTPFTEDLSIDEAALNSTLDFCFDCGVQGVVATANASEVGYLSEAERKRVAQIVVERARGKAMAVVGVSSSHYRLSADFARHAASVGADAVMAMPPTFHAPSAADIRDFYRHLTDATDLPLVLQNAMGPGATTMSPQLMAELIGELPPAKFIKEETQWPAQSTGEVMRLAGDALLGVMGGRAGKTLMEEVPHGICGTMPACEIADVHVALWAAIEAGEGEKSREIFRRLLPLLDYEATYGMPLCKEVLRMRGVITHAGWRQTGARALDKVALEEAATILDGLSDYMLPAYTHRR